MTEKDTESIPSKSVVTAMEKARNKAQSEINAMTESSSMLGEEIPDEIDTRTTEEKVLGSGWEKAVAESDLLTQIDSEIEAPEVPYDPPAVVAANNDALKRLRESKTGEVDDSSGLEMTDMNIKADNLPVQEGGQVWSVNVPVSEEKPEEVKKEKDPAFEKAKAEWREKRDAANELEKEYEEKYEAYILGASKDVQSLRRRMFGIKPNLTPQLQALKDQADKARADFNQSANSLLTSNERFRSRMEPKVVATLPFIHEQRKNQQERILGESWKKRERLNSTLKFLKKNKIALTGLSLGISFVTTGGIAPVVAALGAGIVAGGATRGIMRLNYVDGARERLRLAREEIGDNFLAKSYEELNQEMERLTFLVGEREARTKTISTGVGIAAGIGAAGYVNGLTADSVNNLNDILPPETNNGGFVERVTPETTPIENDANLPTTEEQAGESVSETEATPEVSNESDIFNKPDNRAGGDSSSTPRTSESGVERINSNDEDVGVANNTEPIVKDKTVPEVARDYSLPPYSSVNDLPAIGIIESVPQTPVESSALAENPNLTPVTEAEATAAFGPVTGPSIENLQSADLVTHTVEKGDNVWNILEGKGSDTNPIGGKSEVLEGMNMSDRQSALDKLIEYAEQNPEFAKEVGAVKSDGDIHRVYPGEEINVSMLDDKLRELLGANEVAPESVPASEANVPVEEVGEVDVHEPTTPKVVEEPTEIPDSETATEVQDINNMRVGDILSMQEAVENGDPQILAKLNGMGFDKDSYEALNEAISSNIRSGETYDMTLPLTEWMNQYGQAATPESAPALPQTESSPIPERASDTPNDSGAVVEEAITPVVGNAETAAAVNKYVTGIEKSSGLIFTKPDVSGTFESLKGLSIAEFKAMAGNDNLPTLLEERGVSFDGFMRWGETLQDQVKLIPANDTETIGDYVTRIVKANVRTA